MAKMFIDGTRDPEGNNWIVARSYREAINWMRHHGCPSYISFGSLLGDHGGHLITGIAMWIVQRDIESQRAFIPPDFDYTVHSDNNSELKNVTSIFNHYLDF